MGGCWCVCGVRHRLSLISTATTVKTPCGVATDGTSHEKDYRVRFCLPESTRGGCFFFFKTTMSLLRKAVIAVKPQTVVGFTRVQVRAPLKRRHPRTEPEEKHAFLRKSTVTAKTTTQYG